jgi:hypothetical protein
VILACIGRNPTPVFSLATFPFSRLPVIGYSGSSTTTADFDSKEACEAAGKSHDQAIHQLHWHSFAVVWTCSPTNS